MPAETLQAEVGALEAGLGQEGLDDRRQEAEHVVGEFPGFGILGPGQDVALGAREIDQRAAAFGKCLLRQQHAAHVRVHDDRVRGAVGILGPGQGTHLQAVARVGERILESELRMREPL